MLCEGNKSRLPFCLVGGVGWGGKESLNHLLPERYFKVGANEGTSINRDF